jgi:hypothetical protein
MQLGDKALAQRDPCLYIFPFAGRCDALNEQYITSQGTARYKSSTQTKNHELLLLLLLLADEMNAKWAVVWEDIRRHV